MPSLFGCFNRVRRRAKVKRGRPSKYNQYVLSLCEDYLKNWELLGDQFPSINGMVRYLKLNKAGISRDTVMTWKRDKKGKPEFIDMLDRLANEQERIVLNKAAIGEIKPTIALLILRKHGYSSSRQSSLPIDVKNKPAWTSTVIDPKIVEATRTNKPVNPYTCINQKTKAQKEKDNLSSDQDANEGARVA